MRRFLLLILVILLPFQSFASGVAAFKMINMQMDSATVGAPWHDEMSRSRVQVTPDDCCDQVVTCQAMCSVVPVALLPELTMPHLPASTADKPVALSHLFIDAFPAPPIKPPIS